MRLYLSSFRMGACPGRLVELAGSGTRAAVIANAIDIYPPSVRAEGVERELKALRSLELDAIELDLRPFFGTSDIMGELRRYDIVWVRGGDVFTLRYSLATSRADAALVSLLREDALVYGGYSAGPCVLGPTLRGLEQVDDPSHLKMLYGIDPVWSGLGVIDYCIVPHVDSPDHPESAACNRLADHHRRSNTPHRTLRDGEVLIIDGETSSMCT